MRDGKEVTIDRYAVPQMHEQHVSEVQPGTFPCVFCLRSCSLRLCHCCNIPGLCDSGCSKSPRRGAERAHARALAVFRAEQRFRSRCF